MFGTSYEGPNVFRKCASERSWIIVRDVDDMAAGTAAGF